ncbi:MAG TPA: MGMT family protein [Patescibacteria group bacterium]|nr:MGMT family protein [Patescibacteria group bacterium]
MSIGAVCYNAGMPRASKTFRNRVLAVVRLIPKGSVMTYKEVAFAAGHPGAFRAVGSVMKANVDPGVPCHRVVRSDLRPGEYNRSGGERTKIRRLASEGVRVVRGRIVR